MILILLALHIMQNGTNWNKHLTFNSSKNTSYNQRERYIMKNRINHSIPLCCLKIFMLEQYYWKFRQYGFFGRQWSFRYHWFFQYVYQTLVSILQLIIVYYTCFLIENGSDSPSSQQSHAVRCVLLTLMHGHSLGGKSLCSYLALGKG